jgi:hypothetical protein
VRLFGNLMYSCNHPGVFHGREECYGTVVAAGGILMPRVWDCPDYNFDSVGKVSYAHLWHNLHTQEEKATK